MDDNGPVAMVVGSFTSVSLDPPLVAFFPDRKSTSWPRIEKAGRFCVNVLADHQQRVRRDDIPHRRPDNDPPVIEGVVARIDCDLDAVHEAGDHFIVVGRVRTLAVENPHRPLLFLQGGYGRFSPSTHDRGCEGSNASAGVALGRQASD